MVIQKAPKEREMKDICENKYVQIAHSVGNLSPELKQILDLLGCNPSNRQQNYSTIKPTLTTKKS